MLSEASLEHKEVRMQFLMFLLGWIDLTVQGCSFPCNTTSLDSVNELLALDYKCDPGSPYLFVFRGSDDLTGSAVSAVELNELMDIGLQFPFGKFHISANPIQQEDIKQASYTIVEKANYPCVHIVVLKPSRRRVILFLQAKASRLTIEAGQLPTMSVIVPQYSTTSINVAVKPGRRYIFFAFAPNREPEYYVSLIKEGKVIEGGQANGGTWSTEKSSGNANQVTFMINNSGGPLEIWAGAVEIR
jgi:hypothetical protein